MSLISSSWDWKEEPESPALSVLDVSEDVWLFDVADDVARLDEEERSQPTSKAQVAAKLLEDLEDFGDEFVKDEPFSGWLEDKIDIPIFEDVPPIDQRTNYKSLDAITQVQEFEYIYGKFEHNNGALTPPQSPPTSLYQPESTMAYAQEPETIVLHELTIPKGRNAYTIESHSGLILQNPLSSVILQKPGYTVSNVDDMILLPQEMVPATPQTDVAMELAVVDELVRTRAEDMDVSSDPWEAVASSPESILSPAETSSDSSNCAAEFANDPEWIPETVNSPPPATAATKRKRGKPYGRPVEDKRLRKKEQNKNAATRYRQKKKQEVEVILDEEKGLEDKNSDLHEKVTELQREIKYLKGLMRDLFKAKGILK